MTLQGDEFRRSAVDFVPVRLELVKGDERLKQWKIPQFPGLRILNANGALVQAFDTRSVNSFEREMALARKVEKDFGKALAAADLAKSEVRAQFVEKHLARVDPDSALALYRGFAATDASESRLVALEKVASALTERARLEEVFGLVDQAETLFPGSPRLVAIRLGTFKYRLQRAYLDRNKDLTWKILDEIAEKFPESDLAKRKDETKKWMDTHPPETVDRGE